MEMDSERGKYTLRENKAQGVRQALMSAQWRRGGGGEEIQ
jgi:hypothetical protein